MAIEKARNEFHIVDMEATWEVPVRYPPGFPQNGALGDALFRPGMNA